MQTTSQDNHAFETSLRQQLIAAQNGQAAPAPEPAAQPATQYSASQQQHSRTHQPGHRLDPSIAATHISPYSAMPRPTDASPPLENPLLAAAAASAPGAKKAAKQRELSSTKRAAQNRAAQRAFRQRKEQYICQLESDVKAYRDIEGDVKGLHDEVDHLRAHIKTLQGILSGAKLDFPPCPPVPVRVHRPQFVPATELGIHEYDQLGSRAAQQHYFPEPEYQDARQHQEERVSHAQQQEERASHTQHQEERASHTQHADAPSPHTSDAKPADNRRHEDTRPHSSGVKPAYSGHHDDDLPAVAIDQLRAAAAQAASELDKARSTRPYPEDYASATDHPPAKRQRVEDESRGSTGSSGVLSI